MSHLLKNEHFTVRLTVRGRGGQPPWPIRKASLFAVGRKRDSEEIVLLKNGGFGGRAASCEGSEEHTIDQACILGRPAQFTSWARSLWNLMRAVRSPQLTRHALWADPIGGPPKGKMLNFFSYQINFSAEISISLTV